MHFLGILEDADAPRTVDQFDRITCAEIPDPQMAPELHKLVKTHMIHGPCKGNCPPNHGPPCLKDNECDKDYPKDFKQHTIFGESLSPQYRRRSPKDGGHKVKVYSSYTKQEHMLDNRFVVPYNRVLLAKYKAHINVELIGTVGAIKYLFKYLFNYSFTQ